jgi:hypothetical protein
MEFLVLGLISLADQIIIGELVRNIQYIIDAVVKNK